MKRKINVKTNIIKKRVLIFLIVLIFLFFITSTLVLVNRNFLIIEKAPKVIYSYLSKHFTKKLYIYDNNMDKVIESKIAYLEKENNSLKEILNLKKENEKYIPALVTNKNASIWFNKIDVISNDKVNKGDAVINQNGLVGFVSKVTNNVAEINLLTNINENNMPSVFIENTNKNILGMLSSYDSKKGLFKITNIVGKDEIKKKDKVVLNSYLNKDYKGIYVGEVIDVETSNFGLTKTIFVKSDVDFNDLMYVVVIGEEK